LKYLPSPLRAGQDHAEKRDSGDPKRFACGSQLAETRSVAPRKPPQIERETLDTQRKLDRLLDALADGSLPADEIKARLGAEKARKTALQAELERLDQLSRVASIDTAQLKRQLEASVSDVTALLVRQTVQARQMLRKLLAGKIELEPVGCGRERGYKFRGALTVERLIGGEAIQTSLSVVAPTGTDRPWGFIIEGFAPLAA
jgi:hypothetical protein